MRMSKRISEDRESDNTARSHADTSHHKECVDERNSRWIR